MDLMQISFIAFFVAVVAGLWGYYQWNGAAAKAAKVLFAVAAAVSLVLMCVAPFVHREVIPPPGLPAQP